MTLLPTYKYKPINKFNIFGYLNVLWDKSENGIRFWSIYRDSNIFQVNPLYERRKK